MTVIQRNIIGYLVLIIVIAVEPFGGFTEMVIGIRFFYTEIIIILKAISKFKVEYLLGRY